MIRRVLLSLPLWLAYTACAFVLDAIGLVLILVLSAGGLATLRESRIAPELRAAKKPTLIDVWRGGWLTWLWGNEEDGVTGPDWWITRHPTWRTWRLAYAWSALRNPSNNTRFIPLINPVIDPARIRSTTRVWLGWYFTYTWQGVFSGLLVTFSAFGGMFRFWWGWKLKPQDSAGVADSDMRKPRCGFAVQLKRIGA